MAVSAEGLIVLWIVVVVVAIDVVYMQLYSMKSNKPTTLTVVLFVSPPRAACVVSCTTVSVFTPPVHISVSLGYSSSNNLYQRVTCGADGNKEIFIDLRKQVPFLSHRFILAKRPLLSKGLNVCVGATSF